MSLQSPEQIPGDDVGELLTPGKELAVCQRRDGVGIRQIQLKEDVVRTLECLLAVVRDMVPDTGVRDVYAAEEVTGRLPMDGP